LGFADSAIADGGTEARTLKANIAQDRRELFNFVTEEKGLILGQKAGSPAFNGRTFPSIIGYFPIGF
jgi:hypothetical protein